jgi:hypothetical protein
MNPRDAANAKGCIDSVISFTRTKLLPHVPEMMIRFIHSVESGAFPMCLPQINFACFAETTSRSYRIGFLSYQGERLSTPPCSRHRHRSDRILCRTNTPLMALPIVEMGLGDARLPS